MFLFRKWFSKTNRLAEHMYGNTFHHPGPFCVYYSCKIHKYDHLHLYVKFTLPTEPMQREILGYFLRRTDYKFLSLARSSCAQETSRVLGIIIPFVVKKLTSCFCTQIIHRHILRNFEFLCTRQWLNVHHLRSRANNNDAYSAQSLAFFCYQILTKYIRLSLHPRIVAAMYTLSHTYTKADGHYFFFLLLGLSKSCFMPPPLFVWNLWLRAVSFHGESKWVVSWSTKWVYFVRPERPKFLTWNNRRKYYLT